MPNFLSSYAQGLVDSKIKGHTRQNLDPVQQETNMAIFAYTLVGTEAAADTITLGPLNILGARVVPELCRVRHSAGGAGVSWPATLQKVDKDYANAVALTTKVTLVSTAVQTYASANALPLPEVLKDDILQLVLADTVTSLATRIIYVEVAYRLTGR